MILHGKDIEDSLFYAAFHRICFEKKKKKSKKSSESLKLDLDYQNFKKQCFFINSLLMKEGYFFKNLRIKKKVLLLNT